MLRSGSRLRLAWALGAAALVVFGALFTLTRVNLARFDSELRFRGDAHRSLRTILHAPAVRVDDCRSVLELRVVSHRLALAGHYI